MLQELLKEATKPHHDRLEQLMFVNQIMDGSLSVQQYQKLLLTNYFSHLYFEDQIFSHLSQSLRNDLQISQRVKLPALLKDIEQLLTPIPEKPADANMIPIATDEASLLGAMYVLEGATLGGHVIVKRLLLNPNLQPLDLNYYYYQAYGPDLISKWKQFCQVLNTSVTPEYYSRAIKSAGDMFVNMQRLAEKAGL